MVGFGSRVLSHFCHFFGYIFGEVAKVAFNTLDPNPTISGWSDPEILVIFENTTLELRVEF